MERKNGTFAFIAISVLLPLFLMFEPAPAGAQEGVDTSGLDTLVPIEEETESKAADTGAAPKEKGAAKEATGSVEAIEELETPPEATPEEEKPEKETPKKETLAHPAESGFSGLVHTVSGDSGDPWSWAVGIQAGFFLRDNFIHASDENKYVSGIASFRFTIWKYFEAAVAIKSYANYNKYSDTNPPQFEPPLFQTLGDASLGIRGFYPVHTGIFLGLAYRAILLNKVGEVGIGAANHELLLPFTADIQKYVPKVPLRIHLNVAWLFDESRKLVEDEEAARGVQEGLTCESDDQGNYSPLACISPVERFALGINRVDLLKIGLAIDIPTPYVSPFLEGNMGIAVNRQGFNCGQNMNESPEAQDDYCLQEKGMMANPTNITIGFRVKGIPYGALKGLGILVAADVGITGIDHNSRVRELAMNPTYMIYFGVSYTPVAKPKEVIKVQEVTKTEIKEPPPKPRIIGKVVDAESKAPVEGAVIRFAGLGLTGLVTGADGTFVSYPLEKGEYEMALTAQGYFDATCAAALEETGDKEVQCEMRPMPKLATITGQVLDAEKSSPLSGVNVAFEGPRTKSVSTDASGGFSIEIEAGDYEVKATMDGYFSKAAKVKGPAGASVNVQIMLSKKPKKDLAIIKKKMIKIGKQIQFEFNLATIKPQSYVVLDSVADVIMTHPEIQVVEIQGHTDDKGTAEYNMQLSQNRAESVRDYLISAGVEPDKLIAKGYGKTKPIAPNVTSAGRAKNRRVEFHILQQAGE
jgi:outer membrane protein OmpA-like peptidoglycan-associated protein